VGTTFDSTKTGFKIIGTHTDSPCLKLAPVSASKYKSFSQVFVSTYGGGLWHTWFDRDLILAGKVVYEAEGKYTSKLWRSKRALLKIPNLAIHLRSERNKIDLNTET
jgi:aspartyl aminopeptidase